ncbi:tape measure protein [Microvirga sp. STS02]|uniref:tape measure protein n=1 Tax=Hymenobacter negativus TaxID=2795026 RepID=UPI0018DC2A7D|nr:MULTISPECIES: tape measure protein [Bacteria]MBH8569353.1 tape measure protein [Hymenobacter negativus]MBR7209087.1 tape measure protein [Microvirga sp. STS02]
MSNILASVSVVLGAEIAGFKAGMAAARRELKGLIQFSEGMKDIGASLTTYISAPLALLSGVAVKTAGDFQALEKGFEATYKGAEPLSVALAKVQELAKLPGLGLREALQGATNLQATGFSADLARRALGAFGNALATVGKGKADLDGVGLALGQIASKGKISAEEINQLAERVPQIRAAMQAAFGTSDTEALQKAKISATDFVEGVTKELEKLPKVTGGLNNAFENFSDASSTALAKLGDSLNKAFDIEGLVGRLSDFIADLSNSFAALSPTTQRIIFIFGGIVAAAGPVLFTLGSIGLAIPVLTASFAALGPVAAAAWVAVTGPIGLTVAGLALVTAGLAGAISQFGSARQAAAAFGGYIAELAIGPLEALRDGLATLGFPVLSALIDIASDKAQQLASKLFAIAAPAQKLKGSFDEAFRGGFGFDGALGSVGDFGTALVALTQEQKDALEKLRKELLDNENASRALGPTYDFLGNKAKVLEGGIKSLTDVGFKAGGKTVQSYVAELRAVPTAMDQVAERVAKGLEKMGETPEFKLKSPTLPNLPTSVEALPGYDTSEVSASSEKARQAYQKLTEAQKNAHQRTLDFNTNIEAAFDQLSHAIGPLVGNLAVQVADAFGSIVTGSQGLGDGLTALFGGIISTLGDFMSTFGQQLIAIGIGKVGLDALFSGPQGGPLAIAAGVGLVALAGIAKSVGSNASASLKSIGSGGTGSTGRSVGNIGQTATASAAPLKVQVEVTGTLRGAGKDLVALIAANDYRRLRTT